MRVLVACEESQAVTTALRELGHEAYSCDVQECSGGHPEWHIVGDALALINGQCKFRTMDGAEHMVDGRWDLLIAHPPCTYLTNAGSVRMRVNGEIQPERFAKAMEAKEFFMAFYDADCERIAIENPVPMKLIGLPPYDQIIQPYEYGHPYSKKTCLWLKNCPPPYGRLASWKITSRMLTAGIKIVMETTGNSRVGENVTRRQGAKPFPASPQPWRCSGQGIAERIFNEALFADRCCDLRQPC